MELPYLSNKTIKTIVTLEIVDFAAEVQITFTDGSTLILSGPHITLKYWTATAPLRPGRDDGLGRSKWAGE